MTCAIAGATFAAAAALAAPTTVAAPRPTLQRAIDRVVEAGAPGAIALAGRRVRVSGVADTRSGRAPQAGDRIRIGSATKPFVAVVALQLVAEGRLRLDETVGARLPGVLPSADAATLRQLLNHTSGIPDDVPAALREIFFGDPLRVWTPDELVALAAAREPRFPPGTGWAYSNTDSVLVGLMIERATRHSLEHELDERIVRPLRLRHTSFPVQRAELPEPAARGYSLDLGPDGRPLAGTLRDRTRYSPSFAWASGNGVSSVRDLARFYRALLGGRLLTPELRREALAAVDTGQPGRGYGLGIERYDTSDGPLAGHDGDIVGFSVRVRSTLDGHRPAIVAVNAKFAPEAVEPALDAALEAAVREALR